jgi:hypothetical protein
MSWLHGRKDVGPDPQLLAAYADGELDGPDCQALKEQVESWLAELPEASAELKSLRRLERAWRVTTPADPGEDAWNVLRARLRERLAVAASGQSGWRRWLAWGGGGLSAAAVLWLALNLFWSRPAPKPAAPGPQTPAPNEMADVVPWPVVTEKEVEILHIEGADAETLVVGALPVEGPMVLAGPGDITLKSVQPARPDNMVPGVFLEGSAPMIWAPMDGAQQE